MTERPWAATADGIILTVRLTPKGGRDAVDGIAQAADGKFVLKVRVRAAPREGAANEALVRLVAASLGLPPRAVSLVGGKTARLKRLKIAGPAIALAETLERICGTEDDPPCSA